MNLITSLRPPITFSPSIHYKLQFKSTLGATPKDLGVHFWSGNIFGWLHTWKPLLQEQYLTFENTVPACQRSRTVCGLKHMSPTTLLEAEGVLKSLLSPCLDSRYLIWAMAKAEEQALVMESQHLIWSMFSQDLNSEPVFNGGNALSNSEDYWRGRCFSDGVTAAWQSCEEFTH